MKKYYLVPLHERDIYINGKTLASILEETYPILYERETERIRILYSTSPLQSMPKWQEIKYTNHIKETKKIYDEMQLPQYLLVSGDDRGATEISTKTKITPEYPAALEGREVNYEKAYDYYCSTDYETKIANYFNKIKNIEEYETYNFLGYIDGELEGKSIKGNFKGKIKIKKLPR